MLKNFIEIWIFCEKAWVKWSLDFGMPALIGEHQILLH